jgi:hypothetical protein
MYDSSAILLPGMWPSCVLAAPSICASQFVPLDRRSHFHEPRRTPAHVISRWNCSENVR